MRFHCSAARPAPFARVLLLCLLALATPACTATSKADVDGRLRDAASRGDDDAVRQAIEEGATLEARDGQGRTALLLATHGNNVEAARALIEAGADVNAKDALQDSAYLYAGARGLDEILAMTLAHGADLHSTNRYGGTALIPAAERGHVATVRTLLRAGCRGGSCQPPALDRAAGSDPAWRWRRAPRADRAAAARCRCRSRAG